MLEGDSSNQEGEKRKDSESEELKSDINQEAGEKTVAVELETSKESNNESTTH